MMTPRPTVVSAPSRRTVLFGFSALGAAALTGCVPLSSSKKAEESPSDTATTTSASSSSSPSHSTYSPSTSASSSSSGSSSPVDPAQFIADWQKYVGDAKRRPKATADTFQQPEVPQRRTFPNRILMRRHHVRTLWKVRTRRCSPSSRPSTIYRSLARMNPLRNLSSRKIFR